ncbi:dihydrolipoyllysine-residue acetyltransferase [Pollutimonas sp. M17]|uniref:dihydrolipoyllysine-residue acetyltransferase n=1 Tax=Pollutimonas sp. M17 TaxID=2962065 RepID=UPI0021F4E737|nr:dihydrolipoyllysine-residue acetyltransferase [Pollutimonas sp. M17]UYO95343.1 dihydrolipoyllysine-residue acetyltransferase [Pollutimonas sp. M17]
MSNTIEIKVPDIGDFSEVEVIELLVAQGDTVSAEQSLITVESDKASMEIPSPQAGVVKSLKVKVGDKIKEGSVILQLEAADAAGEKPAEPAVKKTEAAPEQAPAAPQQAKGAESAPAQAAAPQGQGEAVTVAVPDIGDSTDVEVIEIMVSVGDTIAAEQSLITVESDKASMEVPSSHAGVVTAIKVKLGDKVNKGSAILELKADGGAKPAAAAAGAPAPAQEQAPAQEPASSAAQASAPSDPAEGQALASVPPERHSPTEAFADADVPLRNLPHASPSVRKFARELGVNLASVRGSGAKNRITQDDVRKFVKQALSVGGGTGATAAAADGGFSVLGWPKVDFAKFGQIDTKPLSRIKKISGANLHRNWVMIPHVTNNDAADITELEELRQTLNKENQKSGIKVTMLAFLIKAVVAALKKFPEFNASIDGDNLVLKHYYHIGFAADTPNGLVVPVIRDADKKGIVELAKETAELAGLARDGKLSPSQMQGGCFSISSLGGIGGTSFTPIINAPEVAILGVSRSAHAPVWNGKEFQPRLMLPLSLSYDHRVIDGAAAARFNAYLGSLLADFRRIAL